ncbi:restriction endonuclease subunit S [Streptococcus lutetiensis]|uniref:restriction endonuclease subunit S n=1 Tax=Streptococcus lutetiensis TaxID=150055 RepID=UPI001BDADCED|nr:restriction endonuclease subunit S [Streptococcus lutetiensis]MBT0909315.1 restriction endonuclease subunit S [Streptococcus lutetiensis]
MTNKIPNIRFKGFTDDWEQRKFGDEFQRTNERNDGSFGAEHWISVAKMYFQDPEKVQSNNLDTRTYVLRYGDIAFEGNKSKDYKYGRFVANDIGDGIISELFPIYRHISIYDNQFWKYYFKNDSIMAPIFAKALTSSGASSNKIEEKDLVKQIMLVPNLDEQSKIGTYFEEIDHLITLHQRKCEQTKELKKFMLQKMFPKKGEKNPEIRFPGFTDDWEQRKLGELVTFSKGSGYSKGDLLKEGTPIILYGRLYTKYETVISNVDTFVEPKGKSVFSKGGEVIVPGSGETAEDISIASVVEESGVLLGGDLNIITPPKEINSAFLAISISNGKPHKDMAKMAQGKSVVHLHNSDLAKIDFPFPIYEEQCRISNQFAELDNLITLHQRKCEQLKELKKFMLQNMFPKKG